MTRFANRNQSMRLKTLEGPVSMAGAALGAAVGDVHLDVNRESNLMEETGNDSTPDLSINYASKYLADEV